MAVCRADLSELLGIGSQLLLDDQAVFERLAGVLAGKHVISLRSGEIKIAHSPGFIVREFIVRR